jgi:hypothetical protein
VEIASKELLDSNRVEEEKEECEVLVDFENVPASLAWFPGRFQGAWEISLEGITGNLGVKNHVQVTCLGFRLKLTSQTDGGV